MTVKKKAGRRKKCIGDKVVAFHITLPPELAIMLFADRRGPSAAIREALEKSLSSEEVKK